MTLIISVLRVLITSIGSSKRFGGRDEIRLLSMFHIVYFRHDIDGRDCDSDYVVYTRIKLLSWVSAAGANTANGAFVIL